MIGGRGTGTGEAHAFGVRIAGGSKKGGLFGGGLAPSVHPGRGGEEGAEGAESRCGNGARIVRGGDAVARGYTGGVKRAFMFVTLIAGLLGARAGWAQEESPDTGYGRKGSMHLGLSLGLGTSSKGALYGGGAEAGYFVVTGVAPGISVDVSGGTGRSTTGLLMGTLRVVPLRMDSLALFLIGRAGRVLVSSHADGWGAGGGAGVVVGMGSNMGLQISYEILGLMPNSFCKDFESGCRLDSLGLGLIVGL